MGKGRDKRKKHEDPSKAAKRSAKQFHKLNKKEKGDEGTTDNGLVLNNEESIEVTLKKIQKAESKIKTVEEVEKVSPPTARVNVVMCPHPIREQELIIFGGEFFNGELTEAYNDLYFYNTKRKSWAKLLTAINPPPRSSSQGIVYKDYMIIFGGEFVSQTQSQFLHFRDVWRFDAKRSEWTELKSLKGGPSSRSGHRMVLWKRQAVVFGGFYDNAQECHYYNDLWVLSSLEGSGRWQILSVAAGTEMPHPRSGHNMAIHGDTLFVYGGYSTAKFNRFKKSEATVHHDLWMIKLPSSENSTDNVSLVWNKIRLDGIPPPIRCGVGSCFRDKKMYFFGGVVDLESPGGKMISTFSSDLFVFHMDSKRFYPIVLRRKSVKNSVDQGKKEKVNDLGAELRAMNLEDDSSSSSDDEDSDLDEDEPQDNGIKSENMKESYEINKLGQIIPHRRMDTSIVCVGNYLYVYGGQFESKSKEITLSDLYALNLNRLETYEVHLSQDLSAAVWMGKETESNANSWESGSTLVSAAFGYYGEDDDDDEEDMNFIGGSDTAYRTGVPPIASLRSDEDIDQIPEVIPAEIPNEVTPGLSEISKVVESITRTGKKGLKVHKEQLLAQLSSTSGVPTPSKDESFSDFFTRTTAFWETTVRESHEGQVKEKKIKKEAIEFARRRYHEAKELLDQLKIVEEHEKEEAKFFKERRLQKEKEWEEWDRQQQEIEEEEKKKQSNVSQDNSSDGEESIRSN